MKFESEKLIAKHLDPKRVALFLAEVAHANRSFNLYSRNLTAEDLIVLIAESLIPVEIGWLDRESGPVLDIGSGWGIPSVPLLLALPSLDVTLLERSQKKANFLRLLLHRLSLRAGVVSLDLESYDSATKYNTFTLRQVALEDAIRRLMTVMAARGASIVCFGSRSTDIDDRGEVVDYSIDRLPSRRLVKLPVF